MNKKSPLFEVDIDFIAIMNVIWNCKLKIILFVIISSLVGFAYSYQQPNMFLHSLNVKPNDHSEFLKLKFLNEKLDINQQKLKHKYEIEKLFFKRFFEELEDYKEFLFSLSKKYEENEKFNYLGLIKVNKKDENNYILDFKWNDTKEAFDILNKTMRYTLKNLKKSIINELIDNLELQKQKSLIKDLSRIEYLKEQSWIAKELDILDNQSTVITSDIAYYLLGYKAINKEIELIKKRDYANFKIIEKEINSLKKENIEWIKYEINSIQVKSLKDTKLILIFSTLLGLLVGVFYVLISDTFQSKTIPKKRR